MKLNLRFAQYFVFSLAAIIYSPTAMALDKSDFIETTVNVLRISDGDTIKVRFSNSTISTVRILGIQAMEEYDDTTGNPDCNAEYATTKLSALLACDAATNNCPEEPTVVLKVWDTSLTSTSLTGEVRPFRHVFYNNINIATRMIAEGYVLAFSHPSETIYNKSNWIAQQNAISNQTGPLWNTIESQCGSGTGANADIKMWVNWDAPGDDSLPQNRNGEWVKIKNKKNSVLNIGNWTLRDTGLSHIYKFPSGSTIPANGTITAYVGSGTNTSTKFYMNQSSAMFENSIPEGAHLLDYWNSTSLTGHIISSFTYPCLSNCSDPAQGVIRLAANYDAIGSDASNLNGEWVDIINTSNATIDLQSYILHSLLKGSSNYKFNSNSILYAGETMRVYIGSGSGSRLTKYWGNNSSILTNDKGEVWLDTYDSIKIASFVWPDDKMSLSVSAILFLLLN
jgi:endonuclease YncB( thermonuclease family)